MSLTSAGQNLLGRAEGPDTAAILDELLSLIAAPPWHAEAACRDSGLDFFPSRGAATQPLKAVCSTCPVLPECRSAAFAGRGEHFGMWGGLSERERRVMRKDTNTERRQAS